MNRVTTMADAHTPGAPDPSVNGGGETSDAGGKRRQSSKSMHDGVPVWYDCCSCEAEPYWVESGADAGPSDED